MQSNLREHFGIAPPAVEHRAWQDVEVLSEVVQHLLCAGAAPDLQQYMQESLKAGQNGSSAPHAGLISELPSSRQSGACCTRADVCPADMESHGAVCCRLVLVLVAPKMGLRSRQPMLDWVLWLVSLQKDSDGKGVPDIGRRAEGG